MMEILHVMLDKREAFFLHYPHATSDDWINLGAHQNYDHHTKKGAHHQSWLRPLNSTPIYTLSSTMTQDSIFGSSKPIVSTSIFV